MQFTDSFLDYLLYERNYSEKTIVSYRTDLQQFEDFIEKESDVSDIEKADALLIRDWVVSLMEKGYTSTSINRKLSSLRSFYQYLLRRQIIRVDPLNKVVRPKNKKKLPVFLREEEMNRLLDDIAFEDSFKGCRDRMILLMFYDTGMRRSELLNLTNRDVDFSASVIRVTGKRNKQRLIPFDDEMKREMQFYISRRDEDPIRRTNFFFVREDGLPLTADNVTRIVRRNLSKVTTVKKKSPHVLRHTFATAMLNHHADLTSIKELMGHESLATTEIYTHTTFEELKKVYNQAHPRA